MNKKILLFSILAVFMLLAISLSSAVSSNTSKPIKKESPLFRIRTKQSVGDKIGQVLDNIKTKYVGQRVFFLPFQWIRFKIERESLASIIYPTCESNPCTYGTKTDGGCHHTCQPEC